MQYGIFRARWPVGILALSMFLCALSSMAAGGLTGSWSADIGKHSYDLMFDDRNGLSIVRDNEAVVVGEYEVEGSKVTITDLGGPAACQGENASGVYGFEVRGDSLSFNQVSDQCGNRVDLLDGSTFRKSGG